MNNVEEEFFIGPFHYQIINKGKTMRSRNYHTPYFVRVKVGKKWVTVTDSAYGRKSYGEARYEILMDIESRVSKFITRI